MISEPWQDLNMTPITLQQAEAKRLRVVEGEAQRETTTTESPIVFLGFKTVDLWR
jgi:hypothetical protein